MRLPHQCKRPPSLKRGRLLLLALVLGLGLTALLVTGPLAALASVPVPDEQTWQLTPGPNLIGSYKSASQHLLAPGGMLTYTIWLRNTGADEVIAQVTDQLPVQVNYVSDSATPGAAYEGERTLSWANITVPVRSKVSLSFAVTTTGVTRPTIVANSAVITAAGDSIERWALVLLVPEYPRPVTKLASSHKSASQHLFAPGEMLTYTIWLRNTGADEVIAQVTDQLPAQVNYVSDSATPGAVYDEDVGTLSWASITVPVRSDVSLSFAVTTTGVTRPTIVANSAVITAAGDSIERRALVLLVPEHPRPIARLAGSHKSASRHILAPGEMLTYTIWLHNSGTAETVAQVTDRLPAEVNYVIGSATHDASYDKNAGILSWSAVTVPVRGNVSLSFAVTTTGVITPTVITNTAIITADGNAFERRARVLLVPELPDTDSIPPVVHSLTIDEQDVLTSPTVTLHISATDNVEVRWMCLREWQWATTPGPRWKVVQSSGWVSYQADYPWTLGGESGAHFVGVWVADGALNRSQLDTRGLDFASLLQPGATVPPFGIIPYLVYYEAGMDVTAVLTPTTGDADLYVWYTGALSEPISMATKVVTFTTPSTGTYLFLVDGQPAATYDLSIEPGGGPRPQVWGMAEERVAEANQRTSIEISGASGTASDVFSFKADDLISVFVQSGLDPLATAEAPAGPFVVYLPMVVR